MLFVSRTSWHMPYREYSPHICFLTCFLRSPFNCVLFMFLTCHNSVRCSTSFTCTSSSTLTSFPYLPQFTQTTVMQEQRRRFQHALHRSDALFVIELLVLLAFVIVVGYHDVKHLCTTIILYVLHRYKVRISLYLVWIKVSKREQKAARSHAHLRAVRDRAVSLASVLSNYTPHRARVPQKAALSLYVSILPRICT